MHIRQHQPHHTQRSWDSRKHFVHVRCGGSCKLQPVGLTTRLRAVRGDQPHMWALRVLHTHCSRISPLHCIAAHTERQRRWCSFLCNQRTAWHRKQLFLFCPPHQDHAIIDSFRHRPSFRNACRLAPTALSTARPQSSLFSSVLLVSVVNVAISIWLRKSRFTLLH